MLFTSLAEHLTGRRQFLQSAAGFGAAGFGAMATPPLAGPAVSLMLSGHTHGGQIAPAGLPIVTPPGSGRYVTGWYVEGGPPMYVSRGIGTSTLPIRLGASPELVIVDWWLGDSNDAQPLQSA